MNRAEPFPQTFGGSFCIVDTAVLATTRIQRATFRTHDELVIEFRLDDFSHVVSLFRRSNTFFRGTYTIQDKTGDSLEGKVSCHIFEMPEGPFAFGTWVDGALSYNWWAYFDPTTQTSEEPPATKAIQVNAAPAVSKKATNPLPEFKARLTTTIDVTWASGKNDSLGKGTEGSVAVLHDVLQFEADSSAPNMQAVTVDPNEIEIIGFKGKKTEFAPAMRNELDAPKTISARNKAARKVRKA